MIEKFTGTLNKVTVKYILVLRKEYGQETSEEIVKLYSELEDEI